MSPLKKNNLRHRWEEMLISEQDMAFQDLFRYCVYALFLFSPPAL